MALTQSARPGPSWDEEVVPALRKRLESESRTLARRISAISLSSGDEAPPRQNYQPDSEKKNVASSVSNQRLGAQKLHTTVQPQDYSDRKMPTTTTPRVNGSESSSKLKFERTRTYSSPYASGLSNGQPLPSGNARPKANASKSTDPPRSSISRPSDVKPTRIPKVARGGSFSNGHSPFMNGYGHNPSAVTPPSQPQSPEITNQPFPEQRGPQRGVLAASSTRSIVELPSRPSRQGTALLNESPPFTSVSTMSSFSQHDHDTHQTEDPVRPSIDSEERPYEHWYRGEVSRNGGVGELRVGRRQEMLDIANYGHAIGKKKKPATTRVHPVALVDEPRRHRKRADSIGGMTDKEREERGSLYLDEEHASKVGRVLDESPLTDLDGEGSDTNSLSEHRNGPYAYIPEVEDNPTPMPEPWTPTPATYEVRSLTPTPIPLSMIPRPSSRQHQQQSAHPSRIPAPSSSRRSSESRRSTTRSPTPAPMTRGASEPPQLSSSSKTPSPPSTTSSSHPRQQPYASNTLPTTSAQKRAVSPASKKSRTTASKATRAKTTASRKEQDEQQNRKSVAYYPTPGGQEDDDMADAIPSWTQPVHREGNWDEACFTTCHVVLPVVARKKGLDEHYENADGSPQPKKVDKTVAPAPGTFGYDHSKYRPPRNDSESIPMDEFGLPLDQDGSGQRPKLPNEVLPTMHEELNGSKSKQQPSASPAPISRYPPPDMQVVAPFAGMVPLQQQSPEKEGADDAWFLFAALDLSYYSNALGKKEKPTSRILFKERYKIIDKRKNHHASMYNGRCAIVNHAIDSDPSLHDFPESEVTTYLCRFPLTFTREASPLIVYSSGQWTEGSPTEDPFAANYDGSFRVTQTNGATATLNFLASGISLFGALRDNHGNYTVNLDQDPQTTATGFSKVNMFKQPLFQAAGLAYTYHQVTITNVVEPTGPFFDLDFVTIERHIGLPNDQVLQETLDDASSSSITYSPQGSWSPISSSSALQNTLHQTTVAQAQVTIQFQGCCIELYGHYTNARYTVTLDTQAPVAFQGLAVDLTPEQQHPKTLLYLMDGLSEDSHNVTITNSDSNVARPFYFDYAVVWTTKTFTNATGSGAGGSGNSTGTGVSGNSTGTGGSGDSTGTSKSKTPIAPIVGGIIGGLLVLAILATVAFFLRRRSRRHRADTEDTPVPYIDPTHALLPSVAEGLTQSIRTDSPMIPTSYRFPEKGRMAATGTSSSDALSLTADVESTTNAMTSHAHTLSSSSTGLSQMTSTSTPSPIARSLPTSPPLPSRNYRPSHPQEAGPSVPAIRELARTAHEEDAGSIVENSDGPTAVTLPPAYNPAWHQ
ncbi:hypothetical protein BYT27DRAFT_7237607 [Phlegmacium glaucopus]|nr:hypothetical protein BYT27DRAFT_7237607 [Phlegmacium glaucopus]